MLASFLLSLREGLEAALIIGIVLAALRRVKPSSPTSSIWQGVVAAIAFSGLAALALTWMDAEFEGHGEQLFEGATMLLAAGLLTWMMIWMRQQSAGLQKELEAGVAKASAAGGRRWPLFWLSFLAVAREGLELALFLAAIRMATNVFQTASGAVIGLATAAALGWAVFASSKRMSLRLFFNVTNILLIILAAGLLARSVHEFNEAGLIPPVVEHVWDINPILDQQQPVGQLLTALLGYDGAPSLTEILAYGAYLLGAWALWKRMMPAKRVEPARPQRLPIY